jgi:hypothetical protein
MLTVEIERHRFVQYLTRWAWLRGFGCGCVVGFVFALAHCLTWIWLNCANQ